MLDWLWWLSERLGWMAAGACVLVLTLWWLHMGRTEQARVWRPEDKR